MNGTRYAKDITRYVARYRLWRWGIGKDPGVETARPR